MKKQIGIALMVFALLMIPLVSMGDQVYVGAGVAPVAGQPDFQVDGINQGTAAYETEKLGKAGWRFSYTVTNFKHIDTDTTKLRSHILAAETMFVSKLRSGLGLIGAIGPAIFRTTSEVEDIDDETSFDVGLSATGSLRFAFGDSMFFSVALHYKNCAVSSDDGVVDGGYSGIFVNWGLFF